jgi:hypothetical protein
MCTGQGKKRGRTMHAAANVIMQSCRFDLFLCASVRPNGNGGMGTSWAVASCLCRRHVTEKVACICMDAQVSLALCCTATT